MTSGTTSGANKGQAEDLQTQVLGKIGGHFGVRGWLKIRSYTRPLVQILDYQRWLVNSAGAAPGSSQGRGFRHRNAADTQPQWIEWQLESGKTQGAGIIAKLVGIDSREDAEVLIGCDISIASSELSALPEGEYYWSQLIGLTVTNLAGETLGQIDHLLETGANDVMVLLCSTADDEAGKMIERLVPWSDQVVKQVDLDQRTMLVDWDADF